MHKLSEKGSPRACVDVRRGEATPKAGEAGAAQVLVLVAALGLVGFLLVSSSADFKNKLFAQLFSKPSSHAVSGPIDTSYQRVIAVFGECPRSQE